MKTVQHDIEIWKRENGKSFICRVTLGPCPHCKTDEVLIVSDVELSGHNPEQWPEAVHCGNCGARGPWGRSEEDAVEKWNATTETKTEFLSEWKAVDTSPLPDDDGYPF